MKSCTRLFALSFSIGLSTNIGCGRSSNTQSPVLDGMAPDAPPSTSSQTPDPPPPPRPRQATDVCIVDTGVNGGVEYVAEIAGKFYLVGEAVDASGHARVWAAAVSAGCVVDALLTTGIGTNPNSVGRTVTPTGDGNILIRG